MSTLLPTYTANGLSSGLNDTAIIQSLVAAQQAPIQLLQSQQSALQTEISAVGTIASNLQALQTAVANLGSSGAVAAKVLSNNTAFTATAGTTSWVFPTNENGVGDGATLGTDTTSASTMAAIGGAGTVLSSGGGNMELAQATPEPSTLVSLIGAGGLVAMLRRRRASK